MAIDPTTFETPQPQPYSAADFTPLANLGKILQRQQSLADLAKLQTAYLQPQQAIQRDPAISNAGPLGSVTLPGGGISGTNAAFSAPPTSGDINKAINATADIAGMDVPHWKAIASIESSLNPASNSDQPTQYKGLFQIGSRGADSEWSRHGKGSIYNAADNANAAALLADENNQKFKQEFGRDPTPVETYMMHQQGFGFYKNGTMTNIQGNPYPGMRGPQTPQSFEAGWAKELERRARYFQGTGDQ